MFRNSYQDFLSILYARGSRPFENWSQFVKDGYIRCVPEEDIRGLTIEMRSGNVTVCRMNCPKSKTDTLGIRHRYMNILVKNVNKYFTFQVTILDESGMRRRLRFSNFQSSIRISTFEFCAPLCLNSGWNLLRLDLVQITQKVFQTRYMETVRVQINANCWLRRIYFSKELKADHLLPPGYGIDERRPLTVCKTRSNEPVMPLTPPPSEVEEVEQLEESESFKNEILNLDLPSIAEDDVSVNDCETWNVEDEQQSETTESPSVE